MLCVWHKLKFKFSDLYIHKNLKLYNLDFQRKMVTIIANDGLDLLVGSVNLHRRKDNG